MVREHDAPAITPPTHRVSNPTLLRLKQSALLHPYHEEIDSDQDRCAGLVPRRTRKFMYKRTSAVEDPPLAKRMKVDGTVANGASKPSDIDEDLHSRQLAVYGRESMRRMAASNVLIVGALGLGVEVGEASGDLISAGIVSMD